MIPKSMSSALTGDGNRFSEKIMLCLTHDLEKWEPVFGKDHALSKCRRTSAKTSRNISGVSTPVFVL
jgi:hypothetical protein